MTIEVKVPEVGESITEVEIGDWLKAVGDSVQQDEDLVVIETDKATVEILAPQAGRLSKILKSSGETAQVGEVIGHLDQAEHTSVNGAGEDQTSVAESSEAKKPKGRRAKVTKPEQPFSAGESDSEDGPDAQPSATEPTAVFVEQPPQQGETSAPVGPTQAAEIELEARPSVPDREAPSEQTRPAEIPVSSVARDIRSERQEKLLPMS